MRPHPEMVSTTCNLWLRFGATTSAFCMVFQPATLICSTPEPILGAPGLGVGLERPWPLFWAHNGGPRNMILWRDWSPTRFPWIFCEGNGLYGTQEPFGCTNFPPNPPSETLYKEFLQTQKILGPTWACGGLPIARCGGCLLTLQRSYCLFCHPQSWSLLLSVFFIAAEAFDHARALWAVPNCHGLHVLPQVNE